MAFAPRCPAEAGGRTSKRGANARSRARFAVSLQVGLGQTTLLDVCPTQLCANRAFRAVMFAANRESSAAVMACQRAACMASPRSSAASACALARAAAASPCSANRRSAACSTSRCGAGAALSLAGRCRIRGEPFGRSQRSGRFGARRIDIFVFPTAEGSDMPFRLKDVSSS
jgi:hypothetical protein